jgi:hypothetical protein
MFYLLNDENITTFETNLIKSEFKFLVKIDLPLFPKTNRIRLQFNNDHELAY